MKGIGSQNVSACPAESEPSDATQGNWSSLLSRAAAPDAALALMFVAGGSLGVFYILMPHWYVARPGLILAASLGAIAFTPLIWFPRRHMGSRDRHLVLVVGTIVTTVAAYGDGVGPSSMSTAHFYFWVVLYAAAFFRASRHECGSIEGSTLVVPSAGRTFAMRPSDVPSPGRGCAFLDHCRLRHRAGGVNVERAQRSEHERR